MKPSSLFLCVALGLGVVACGGPLKYQVQSSSRAPGADAKVTADVKEDQSLTELKIEATNLPPADRVSNGATTYVVWHRKDTKSPWARSGGLQYDESSRKAQWQGTVPETSFDLAISAEADASAAAPSGETVFSQRVEKK